VRGPSHSAARRAKAPLQIGRHQGDRLLTRVSLLEITCRDRGREDAVLPSIHHTELERAVLSQQKGTQEQVALQWSLGGMPPFTVAALPETIESQWGSIQEGLNVSPPRPSLGYSSLGTLKEL